jgi:hypothetical protein
MAVVIAVRTVDVDRQGVSFEGDAAWGRVLLVRERGEDRFYFLISSKRAL